MRLRGVGGVRAVRAGMGGVRVFSGGVSDGRGGRRWERWGLEKERVVVGAVRAVGTVGGDENKRGCPKSFS